VVREAVVRGLTMKCGLLSFGTVLLATVVLAGAGAPPPAAVRVVAIGDVHGAVDSFAGMLQKAGLIDAGRRWTGGNAILVQTGDMTDRGAGMRAALDLLMALEPQARKAGGRVHALLGNHEVMNLVGELRDANEAIFATFGGEAAMREAFSPRGTYGRWLRGKRVIEAIDGSIFLHGGINPEFSKGSIGDINRQARTELAAWDAGVAWLLERKLVSRAPKFLEAVEAARLEVQRLAEGPLREELDTRQALAVLLPLTNIGSSSLFSPDGPLWFRGFASWSDAEGEPRVAALLDRLRGQRLVVGHSVQKEVTARFGGRIFLIDTGMLGPPYFPSGRASALELIGGAARPLYLD
jgi:hypothetical protein